MVIMRRYALNILTVFLLLILTICDTALAEERQVYAAQGDVAFFKENGSAINSWECFASR